jgi:hypothetical protein
VCCAVYAEYYAKLQRGLSSQEDVEFKTETMEDWEESGEEDDDDFTEVDPAATKKRPYEEIGEENTYNAKHCSVGTLLDFLS